MLFFGFFISILKFCLNYYLEEKHIEYYIPRGFFKINVNQILPLYLYAFNNL